MDHHLRVLELVFWRDVAAWPLVALDRVVDLGWLLTPRGQDCISLGFAAALVVYGIGKFPFPSRAAKPLDRRPRRIA